MDNALLIMVTLALAVGIILVFLFRRRTSEHIEIIHHTNALQQQINTLLEEVAELKSDKKQLLSFVNHDIKSPFNRLYALVKLFKLESEGLNETQLDYLDRLEFSTTSGLMLIRNLMDLRTIEGNDISVVNEEVDITQLISKTIRTFEASLHRKKISVVPSASSRKILVNSDARWVQRIFENLFINAIKYTPKEGSISINIQEKEMNCIISIADNGPGINENEREQLFQKFQVLSSVPSGDESSTGLGLYNAATIAKAINGSINFKPNLPTGAVFEFCVPM